MMCAKCDMCQNAMCAIFGMCMAVRMRKTYFCARGLLFAPNLGHTLLLHRAVGRKMYFKVLKIQPIQLNVTLIPSPSSGPEAPEARSRYRVAAALGIQYANISHVPIKISSLELYDAFLSGSQLGEAVRQHLVSAVRAWTSSSYCMLAVKTHLATQHKSVLL